MKGSVKPMDFRIRSICTRTFIVAYFFSIYFVFGSLILTCSCFQGLLQLEGELPPILASLVKSDKHVNGMLDTTADVSLKMLRYATISFSLRSFNCSFLNLFMLISIKYHVLCYVPCSSISNPLIRSPAYSLKVDIIFCFSWYHFLSIFKVG